MDQSLFDRIEVEPEALALGLNFVEQGSQQISGAYGRRIRRLVGDFPSGVYRLSVTFPDVRDTWNQSGWLSAYLNESYCFSHWVPIGDSFFFLPPPHQYSVFFTPVRWLPLSQVTVSQFIGQWSERIRSLESQIANLDLVVNQSIDELADEVAGDLLENLNPEWDWRVNLPE